MTTAMPPVVAAIINVAHLTASHRTWEQQAEYAAQTSGAGGHEGAPLYHPVWSRLSGYCPLLLPRGAARRRRRRRCAAATTLGTLAHMARWLLLSPASIASDLGFGISTRTLGLELHFVATYTTSLLLASPLLRTLGPVLTAACGSLLLGGACALLLLFDEDAALPNLPSQYVTGMALLVPVGASARPLPKPLCSRIHAIARAGWHHLGSWWR